jgi:hypothetical protein
MVMLSIDVQVVLGRLGALARTGRRLDSRSRRDDDRFGELADRELDLVEALHFSRRQRHIRHFERRETFHGDVEVVAPRRERRNAEHPVAIGDDGTRRGGRLLGDGDSGPGKGSTLCVDDRTG